MRNGSAGYSTSARSDGNSPSARFRLTVVTWCEHNYAVSFYVAEFFNCFSNLAIVAAGLLGLRNALRHGYPRRVLVLYTAITVIGLGSAAFHGTLTHEGQQGDETPMVWGIIIWCWCLVFFDPAREEAWPALARATAYAGAIFAAIFAVVHYRLAQFEFFLAVFTSICTVCVLLIIRMYRRCEHPGARRLMNGYLLSLAVGLVVWVTDQKLCDRLHALPTGNPQFHAWWHVAMSYNLYLSAVFYTHQRLALQSGKQPILVGSFLPYVEPPRYHLRRK